ncbi:MAG: hypothetical protein ACLR8Y_13810 [Alistipes indistinctus]
MSFFEIYYNQLVDNGIIDPRLALGLLGAVLLLLRSSSSTITSAFTAGFPATATTGESTRKRYRRPYR